MVLDDSTVFLAYTLVYGVAVLACGVGLLRAVRVDDAATRRGLVGLLVGSGGWALFELLFLVVPGQPAKYAFYVLSLIVGLTTVGAWLYFCSAYTGRVFHRNVTYRRLAVAVYLAITAVKVTNPIHGRYFTTVFVTTPFPHVTIQHQTAHWVVAGLSYALVAVGFFMLYETFLTADYDTRPLGALVAVTGLPVVFDLVGFSSRALLDLNYEPIGVAVFAVGVLYVFDDRFLAVQLTGDVDAPVVYLDGADRIREYNGRAATLLPDLADAVGRPLAEALPEVAATLGAEDPILRLTRDGEPRYYLASDTAFTLGRTDIGRLVVLSDVTATERRRRQLARQNDSLGSFAAAINHEFRNALTVIGGHVALAGEALEKGDLTRARETLDTAATANERMAAVVDDLAALARHSRTVDATKPIDVGAVATAVFEEVAPAGVSLTVEGSGTIEAEPGRLHDLFENAFRFAGATDAAGVTVGLDGDALVITIAGAPLDDADPDQYLAYATAVPSAETGRLLPNLQVIAHAHGWDVALDLEDADGVRIEITGVTTEPPDGTERSDAGSPVPTDPTG